jgi:hypothetical protein
LSFAEKRGGLGKPKLGGATLRALRTLFWPIGMKVGVAKTLFSSMWCLQTICFVEPVSGNVLFRWVLEDQQHCRREANHRLESMTGPHIGQGNAMLGKSC